MTKAPPVASEEFALVRAFPYCSACRTPVADISTNHHVCVPDDKGGFVQTTRDEASAEQEARAEAAAADAAAVEPSAEVAS